jgi:hypothetical protein
VIEGQPAFCSQLAVLLVAVEEWVCRVLHLRFALGAAVVLVEPELEPEPAPAP